MTTSTRFWHLLESFVVDNAPFHFQHRQRHDLLCHPLQYKQPPRKDTTRGVCLLRVVLDPWKNRLLHWRRGRRSIRIQDLHPEERTEFQQLPPVTWDRGCRIWVLRKEVLASPYWVLTVRRP